MFPYSGAAKHLYVLKQEVRPACLCITNSSNLSEHPRSVYQDCVCVCVFCMSESDLKHSCVLLLACVCVGVAVNRLLTACSARSVYVLCHVSQRGGA